MENGKATAGMDGGERKEKRGASKHAVGTHTETPTEAPWRPK